MGIRGSILNYCFDSFASQMVEMDSSSLIIDNSVILNQNFIRAAHYSRQMLRHGKSLALVGNPGT